MGHNNLKPAHHHKRTKAPSNGKKEYNSKRHKTARSYLLATHGNICSSCGEVHMDKDIHMDHIKPLADGGTTILSNLQLLCRWCHGAKSKLEQSGGT